ncbi:hypothetical protein ACH0B5_03515 [Ureibacillus sp. 179-F W5.1 NHS]
MLSRLKEDLIKLRNTNVIKLHLRGKSINEIASILKLSQNKVLEIIEEFELDRRK